MTKIYMVRIELVSIHESDKLLDVSFHGAFKSYRSASEWLVGEGFEVFYDDDISELVNDHFIGFICEDKEHDQESSGYVETFSIFE